MLDVDCPSVCSDVVALSLSSMVWILNNWLSFKHLSDLTFIYWLARVVELELVATSSHAENFEAVYLRDESRRRHHLVVEMLQRE